MRPIFLSLDTLKLTVENLRGNPNAKLHASQVASEVDGDLVPAIYNRIGVPCEDERIERARYTVKYIQLHLERESHSHRRVAIRILAANLYNLALDAPGFDQHTRKTLIAEAKAAAGHGSDKADVVLQNAIAEGEEAFSQGRNLKIHLDKKFRFAEGEIKDLYRLAQDMKLASDVRAQFALTAFEISESMSRLNPKIERRQVNVLTDLLLDYLEQPVLEKDLPVGMRQNMLNWATQENAKGEAKTDEAHRKQTTPRITALRASRSGYDPS